MSGPERTKRDELAELRRLEAAAKNLRAINANYSASLLERKAKRIAARVDPSRPGYI